MRKFLITVAVAVMMAGFASVVQAQTYPVVRDLEQFTMSSNYMSLPGYLRWVHYRERGFWLSRQEVENVVRAQLGFVPSAPTG